MAIQSHGMMKVEMRDPDIVAPDALGHLQMPRVRRRQARLVVFAA